MPYPSSCGEMARMINNDCKVNIGNFRKTQTHKKLESQHSENEVTITDLS
jgi:hypothetical protein